MYKNHLPMQKLKSLENQQVTRSR